MQPVATNYIPDITGDQCVGCGKCAKDMSGIGYIHGGRRNGRKRAVVDKDICLGCGVCARNCGVKAIHMERRSEQIITPVNSTHRFVLQAIEKGTLANLVFDNQAFSNHRAMAALFSAILSCRLSRPWPANSSSLFTWTGCWRKRRRDEQGETINNRSRDYRRDGREEEGKILALSIFTVLFIII